MSQRAFDRGSRGAADELSPDVQRKDEARVRASEPDPSLTRHVARVRAARLRRRPAPSVTRADSLRAALWACRRCRRRQTQHRPICRYCGAAQVTH